MAEGILRHKAQLRGIHLEIDSAGTGNYHVGQGPDERAIECLASGKIDISGLRARQFCVDDFEEFDLIYVMDESNLRNVLALAINDTQKTKIHLMLGNGRGQISSVPDPWFGNIDDFHSVREMLEVACDHLLDYLPDKFLS